MTVAATAPPVAASNADDAEARRAVAWQAAQRAYFAELAARLSGSRQPREVMVAARLLEHPGGPGADRDDTSVPANRAARAALQRARELAPDDPVIAWQVAVHPMSKPRGCGVSPAVAALRALAPSNAAVWVMPDSGDPRIGCMPDEQRDPALERLRIVRALAASRHDSYFGDLLRSILQGLERQPIPDALRTLPGAPADSATPSLVRLSLAYALLVGNPTMDAIGLHQLCGEEAIASDPARRDACVPMLRRVFERADQVGAQRSAVRLLLASMPDEASRDAVLRQQRELDWQVAAGLDLTVESSAANESYDAYAAFLLDRWRQPGATEVRVMRESLRHRGFALTPPADWKWTPVMPDAVP